MANKAIRFALKAAAAGSALTFMITAAPAQAAVTTSEVNTNTTTTKQYADKDIDWGKVMKIYNSHNECLFWKAAKFPFGGADCIDTDSGATALVQH